MCAETLSFQRILYRMDLEMWAPEMEMGKLLVVGETGKNGTLSLYKPFHGHEQ